MSLIETQKLKQSISFDISFDIIQERYLNFELLFEYSIELKLIESYFC